MPTQELLDKIRDAEIDIANCQKTIDYSRTLFPFDNVIQSILDNQQRQLDRQKKDIRDLKEIAGIVSM